MGHSQALKHKNLLLAGLDDLIRRPVRSVVVTTCLVVMLVPLITGFAVSEGIRLQAAVSVKEGANVFVSQDQYSGNMSIPLKLIGKLSAIEGISRAAARVVGRTYFSDRLVAIVGLDRESLRSLKPVVTGEIPEARGEVIVGHGLTRRFGIDAGMPFTLAANKRKVFRAIGSLSSSCLWCSDLLVMHYDDANEFFRITGEATQALLYASAESLPAVERAVADLSGEADAQPRPLRIESRGKSEERLRLGYTYTDGVFTVLFICGAGLAVLAILITSGFGQTEVGREIGVMKAVGWTTADIVEKVALENFVLSLAAVSIAILACFAWMKFFNGFFIGQFYIAEVGLIPDISIPARILPLHGAICLVLALCVTQMGSLIFAWISARKAPVESIRQ